MSKHALKVYTIQKFDQGYAFTIFDDGEQPTQGVIAQGEVPHPAIVEVIVEYFHRILQSNFEDMFDMSRFQPPQGPPGPPPDPYGDMP